jgi:hypothetical protein
LPDDVRAFVGVLGQLVQFPERASHRYIAGRRSIIELLVVFVTPPRWLEPRRRCSPKLGSPKIRVGCLTAPSRGHYCPGSASLMGTA